MVFLPYRLGRLVIEMAHRFELQFIAEGVEDRYVVNYLKKEQCDRVQGSFFSRLLPAENLTARPDSYQPEIEGRF